MISPTVLSRVIALVREAAVEPRRAMVTGDALLASALGIGPVDRVRIATALEQEFKAAIPDRAIEEWLIVADIARSVEIHARCS